MKVQFIHERVSPEGAVERRSTRFDQDEVLIGRGGASDIVLSNPRLSMVHAKLYQEEGRVLVVDLDSPLGVRVNTVRVSRGVLNSGDVLELGDLSILVELSGDLVALTCRVVSDDPGADATNVPLQVRKLQVDSYLPRMGLLSLLCAMTVLVGCFVYPLCAGHYSSWNSGTVSNAHRMIEMDCQRCHRTPFKRVDDQECLACHAISEHAEGHKDLVATHRKQEVRCAECHMEHNGDHGLLLRDSRQCVSCHAEMTDGSKESDVLSVASLATHPEFRISTLDENGASRRVFVNEPHKAVDGSAIKFNHAVHLKEDLRGPNGTTTLGCDSCHQSSSDRKDMMPVRFDAHCRECHTLGFDERLPNTELPHGNGEVVYSTLFAEYARLLLLGRDRDGERAQADTRSLPGVHDQPEDARLVGPEAQLIEASARHAEKEVFTRTGCFLCHTYAEKPLSQQRIDETRYTITNPNIPERWMTRARFDHGAHEDLSCESCHEGTRRSSDTKDLLLPSIAVCRECHIDGALPGFVKSDCAQCHAYHSGVELSRPKKQNLSDFIRSLTR
jgi:pSer/pThr/pTyr-binding forkhead associated (FHA) protein